MGTFEIEPPDSNLPCYSWLTGFACASQAWQPHVLFRRFDDAQDVSRRGRKTKTSPFLVLAAGLVILRGRASWAIS